MITIFPLDDDGILVLKKLVISIKYTVFTCE